MSNRTHVVKAITGLGAAGVLAVSGAALASSQTPSAGSTQTSSSATSSTGGQAQGAAIYGFRHHGTPVTGSQLTKVTAAVKAKDSTVSVERVMKEQDGRYVVFGTKAGQRVHVEVSKDLKTVTVHTGGSRGERGGPGGRHERGTAVTGASLTTVKNAVKAKDASVTVEKVFKHADGSYDAMGTKAGKRVHVEVSKDLKTVTVRTGGHMGHGGPRGGEQAPSSGSGSSSSSATGSVSTTAA